MSVDPNETQGSYATVMEQSPELKTGAEVGDFRVVKRLGAGAMGAVYEAVHPKIGKHVAVKVVGDHFCNDSIGLARFQREARAIASLTSPHVVGAFSFGELPDGRPYYTMELLRGQSLRERMQKGHVPLDEAISILEQISRGLEAAHAANIIHRDLKPENVFVTSDGTVKIVDFGLVKMSEQPDEVVTRTSTSVLFGTPRYCSPEQIRSAGSVDHRTDLYALGVIAYELILDRPPFVGSVVEVIAKHLSEDPPDPKMIKTLPGALARLLPALLAKEPAKRPSIGHVQETIERVRAEAFSGEVPRFTKLALALAPRRGVVLPLAAIVLVATIATLSYRCVSGVVKQPSVAIHVDALPPVDVAPIDAKPLDAAIVVQDAAPPPPKVIPPRRHETVKPPPAEPKPLVVEPKKPNPNGTINPFHRGQP
jgi:serine/threonine-protein kinase